MIDFTTRPLSDRTWLRPDDAREESRFTTTWTDTLELLDREVRALGGDHVVIEVDIPESSIRIDGRPKANARAATPAVRVAFDSTHGPLIYSGDLYVPGWRSQMADWQHNVRAVALTLDGLRAADRHGATQRGQQYTGFRALPAGSSTGSSSEMTSSAAAELLRAYATPGADLKDAYIAAARATHPDVARGRAADWDRVQEAARVLGLAR